MTNFLLPERNPGWVERRLGDFVAGICWVAVQIDKLQINASRESVKHPEQKFVRLVSESLQGQASREHEDR